MMHNNHFMFWAARSIGKTWLTALFCIVRCILYPGSKIVITSSTRQQGNEVLSKIEEDFMKNFDWGSDNLCREISYHNIGTNKAEIHFYNGSWIKVATASDNARGMRANVLVVDEFRMVDKNTIQTVLKRFLGTPRQPNYLTVKEYENKPEYLETNIEIYMSSAWYKSHWSYDKSKAYTVNLLGGREGYFVCGLPYQIAIKEGLKKRIEIEDEMSEADFDQTTFDIEMGCLPFGSSDGAFFSFDDIDSCRKNKNAIYPLSFNLKDKKIKIPELATNERRILSIDIALMASTKHKNDASSIIINSALPDSRNRYIANPLYFETHEGKSTDELALIVRRLYEQFKCTDLVIDTQGSGLGVYDALIRDIVDYDTGELYKALNCCNNKDMAERCKVDNAPKVIWSIKGSPSFNTEICTLLRGGFKNHRINLLVSEFEAEEHLKDVIKNYSSMSPSEQLDLKMPFVQTTLLIYELINLQYETKGSNIRVYEKAGMRKDRYSSMAYNFWVMNQLDRQLEEESNKTFDVASYAQQIKKLNRKINYY